MKNNFTKGYSVIEIVVYLAIFSALSITIINSFIVVSSSMMTTRTNRDLLESGSSSMERISREIRQAKSVDIANSTFGTNPGVLQLNSTDNSGTAKIIKFTTSSGVLNLYENGVLSGSIIGSNISTTNLIFRRIVTIKGEAIKIEMTLQDKRSKTQRLEKFYNTVILRGGY